MEALEKIVGHPETEHAPQIALARGISTAEEIDLVPEIDLVDRPPVNATLIKIIEGDGYELTDARFFQLIGESPRYLGYGPFQERIVRWQHVMNSEMYEDGDRQRAKMNLLKIGATLARDGAERGRPDKFNDDTIRFRYADAVKLAEGFLTGDEAAKRGMDTIKAELKEQGKRLITTSRRSATEIAADMIALRFGISKRQLRKILKESERRKQQVIREGFVPPEE